ncbi:hypothetical protein MMC27_004285 [Xylographa pallens]|nr:hypothetical protein [Xylographa pallens]
MYRLLADVFNDIAMVLDCLSPALPKVPRVMLLSASSVLRALCGVAAGSSKASLSAHFAKWGNLGELNAKDSSQETIISLLGMLAGSLVVSYVKSPMATWSWLILLLSIHLAMNHAAVRAVSMHTLNRQRANIVISTMLDQHKALTPDEVSLQERIFERDGVLRWRGTRVIGKAKIGVSLQSVVGFLGPPHNVTGSVRHPSVDLERLVGIFQDEDYLLWYERSCHLAMIVLKSKAPPQSQLKAWSHALLMAQLHASEDSASANPQSMDEETLQRLQETLTEISIRWGQSLIALEQCGWDLNDLINPHTPAAHRGITSDPRIIGFEAEVVGISDPFGQTPRILLSYVRSMNIMDQGLRTLAQAASYELTALGERQSNRSGFWKNDISSLGRARIGGV